jgi:hypothetical protein
LGNNIINSLSVILFEFVVFCTGDFIPGVVMYASNIKAYYMYSPNH